MQTQSTRSLRPGQHVCEMYSDADELSCAVSRFVAAGLDAGDLVVHVTGDAVLTVTSYLIGADIGAPAALRSGQLRILAAADVPPDLSGSRTAGLAEQVIAILDARAREGYAAVRMSSEVDSVVGEETVEEMIAREQLATQLTLLHPMIGMCLYDRRRFAPTLLDQVVEQHDAVVAPDGDHLLYSDSVLNVTTLRRRPGVRISGEVDVSNTAHLRDALVAALASPESARGAGEPGDFHIDVGELGFIDVAGLRTLDEVARRHPQQRIVLTAPSIDLRRQLGLLPWPLESNLVLESEGRQPWA